MSGDWVDFPIQPKHSAAQTCRIRLTRDHFSQRLMRETLERGESYEVDTSRLLLTALRPGDLFMDIGAHVGYFSILGAVAVGPEGHVIAVEANPDNAEQLSGNLLENGFTHVVHHQAAAGAKPGLATFFLNSDNDGGHALWEVGRHPWNKQSRVDDQKLEVEVTTLDVLAKGMTPRAIKIDTEGAELDILRGAPELLARHPDFIVCEANRFGLKQMGGSEEDLRALMKSYGYRCYYINSKAPWFVALEEGQYVQSDEIFNLLFSTDEAIGELSA